MAHRSASHGTPTAYPPHTPSSIGAAAAGGPAGGPQASGRYSSRSSGAGGYAEPLEGKAATPSAGGQAGQVAAGQAVGQHDGGGAFGEMVELEHVIGYTGRQPHTVHAHPVNPDEFVYSLGATVVSGKVGDPHRQAFFRGHDEEVTAVALSPSGTLIASGQLGSTKSPEKVAPVVVWDYARQTAVFNLFGITLGVTNVAFSPDDQFLAATGRNNMMFIWDMQTGEQLVGKKYTAEVEFLAWAPLMTRTRRPTYLLCTATHTQVLLNEVVYDPRSMRYIMNTTPFAMPSSGFIRSYPFGFCTAEELIAGTVGGEFAVFNLQTRVYRSCIRVSANGTLCVAKLADGSLLFGSGDGKLQKFVGRDTNWKCTAETTLRGKVVSASCSAGGAYALVGTSNGKLYKVATDTLEAVELEESHLASVTCVAFGTKRSDVFVTGSADGTVRVWDLSDYRVLQESFGTGAVTSVFFDDEFIVSGWADGVVRGFEAGTGTELWKFVAHRGAVLSVAVSPACIITGGEDGRVAVWSRRTRELLVPFSEHRGVVTAVVPDLANPAVIHSVGSDRCVYTYDLKTERRVVGHQMSKDGVGTFLCLDQRRDHELELVCGGADGKLLFWDIDYDAPVMVLQDPARSRVNAVSVSPSGRFLAFCGDDHFVKIFDIHRQSLLAANLGHSARVLGVRWTPDEKQLVSVGEDCCICVWNFYGIDG